MPFRFGYLDQVSRLLLFLVEITFGNRVFDRGVFDEKDYAFTMNCQQRMHRVEHSWQSI